jgi:transposase
LAADQKQAQRTGAQIVFVDETGFSCRAKTATTWAPVGQTPVLRRVSQRRELSTVVGLTLSGKIYTRHFEHAVCGEDIVAALQHFQRHVPGPMILIWDRLAAHRSTVVKEYLTGHPELDMAWLPPYAPDLNPEEGCHGNVKQHLRHAAPVSLHEIRAQVDRGFARLRRRPDLMLGFFRHAGLDVKQLW